MRTAIRGRGGCRSVRTVLEVRVGGEGGRRVCCTLFWRSRCNHRAGRSFSAESGRFADIDNAPRGSELEFEFLQILTLESASPNISARAMSEHKKSKSKHGDAPTEKIGGKDATQKKREKKKKRRDDGAGNAALSLLADESVINPALSSLFAPKVSLSNVVLSVEDERRLTSFHSPRHSSQRQKSRPERHLKRQYQMTFPLLQSLNLKGRLMRIFVCWSSQSMESQV